MEAVVTSDFFPTGTEEVDARQGEKLNVLTFMDNGEWVKVETARRVGFIPMNHIRIKPIWWYFGKLKRIDAEWILSECARNEGAFLIRSSESHPGEFSLSMKHNNAVEHYQIRKDHLGKYSIWQLKFASLNLLVDHYQRASISLDEYAYLAPIEPHERHKTIVIAVALYDFETQEEAELCFRRGQTLIITDRSDENWWQARTAHSKGFIPACYVRIIRTLNECPQMCYKDVECAIAGTSCAGRIFYPEMDDIALNANVLGCVDQNLRYRFAENTPTPIKHKEDKDVEKSTRTDRNRERRTLNVRIAEGKVLLNCFWSKSRSRSGDSSCSI